MTVNDFTPTNALTCSDVSSVSVFPTTSDTCSPAIDHVPAFAYRGTVNAPDHTPLFTVPEANCNDTPAHPPPGTANHTSRYLTPERASDTSIDTTTSAEPDETSTEPGDTDTEPTTGANTSDSEVCASSPSDPPSRPTPSAIVNEPNTSCARPLLMFVQFPSRSCAYAEIEYSPFTTGSGTSHS